MVAGACSPESSSAGAALVPDAQPGSVSAFAPAADAGCRTGYNFRQEICVHDAFEAPDAAVLAVMITDYKRGARAPMVEVGGSVQHTSTRERIRALAPDALTTGARDAEQAKQKRLRSLDAMLARLREKNGESARAAAPDAGRAADKAGQHTAENAGGLSQKENTASLAQKLEELKALVQRLPESDSQTLRTQLTRDGFTADEMQGLLPEAR